MITTIHASRLAVCIALAMAGCTSAPRKEMARYDLERAAPAAAARGVVAVEVDSVSWLAGTEMHYRLHSEPGRRRVFAESRWAAPPAELLAHALNRSTLVTEAGACRVRLHLEELEQRYDAQGNSQLRLDVQASLLAPVGDVALAGRAFSFQQEVTAPTIPAGAGQGAAAAAQALGLLAQALDAWVDSQGALGCQRKPARSGSQVDAGGTAPAMRSH